MDRTMLSTRCSLRYKAWNRFLRACLLFWVSATSFAADPKILFYSEAWCTNSKRTHTFSASFELVGQSPQTQVWRNGNSGFDNDDYKSMTLYGPMGKGTRIRAYDSDGGVCGDDWSETLLLKDLFEGMTKCMGSFENFYLEEFFFSNRGGGTTGNLNGK
eukprot:1218125-Rhodomonas_salina.1